MEKNSQAVIPDNIIVVEGDGLNPVPTPEAGDAGKVLGVLNSSGDIGWVEDQGGTLTQIQSDWAETDSSKVSYIDHKPDLSVYATTSAVNTALAGKQDTISDLSDIRSGAAKGDTAVQPATLESYATTSAMNTALAGKQDTISDLATIRSGAAAGATAVQPAALESYATTSAMNTALADKQDVISDLSDIRSGAALGATAVQPSDMPSSDELVPSASSGDAGKVLTVDSQGEPQWVTPSGGTTYSAGDGIAIDGSNVISADVDGVTIGIDSTTKKIKSLQTIPSVDQTYNASSTNAQSGTAVAQAIASIPSSSYTAGDGIDITSNEISVDYDTNTLDVVGQTVTESVTQQSSSGLFLLPSSVAALLSQQTNTQVTVHIPANTLKDVNFDYSEEPSVTFRFTLYATDSTSETNVSLFSTPLTWENYNWGEYGLIEEQDLVFDLPATVSNQWSQSLSSAVAFSICGQRNSTPLTDSPVELFGDLSTNPITFTFVEASAPQKLAVKNPLPASAQADSGKVLKVNASGHAEWGTDGFTTTAGITDIQVVNALPASPVATVLYLLPEA